MRDRKSREALLEAIGNHPGIPLAAITGSVAREGGEDAFSEAWSAVVSNGVSPHNQELNALFVQ